MWEACGRRETRDDMGERGEEERGEKERGIGGTVSLRGERWGEMRERWGSHPVTV